MIELPKIELRTCAHCGGKDIRLSRTITDNAVYWYVECIGCGMRTMGFPEDCNITDNSDHAFKAIHDAVECAIDVWNTRV